MNMQIKSTRGVQDADVWAAADQLIGEGLRPTIERVRLKMGRGSPNTVSPMLDGWFASLGARLGVGSDAPPTASDLPTAVWQVAGKLWDTALLEAVAVADQRLMASRLTLDSERASMDRREIDLAQREIGLMERQNTLEALLQVARAQVVDLTVRLEQSEMRADRREAEIEALQLKLTHLDAQRMADQRSAQEQFQNHAQERHRLKAHAVITERRWMTELDRERQETKRLMSKLEQSELQVQTVGTQFQAQLQAQAQKQMDADQALKTERQASLAIHQRASELQKLLDDLVKENAITLAQMNQLLKSVSAKEPNAARFGRRVKVKAVQSRSSP
ncbi:MAG: DNA-binding protein [Candidatus Saccharibacteria bacterium]|nr:DNA-binding protein [Rhodoferax sp.]